MFYYRSVGHFCALEENKNVNAAQFGNFAMCFIDRASQSYNAVNMNMKLLLQKMYLLVVIYCLVSNVGNSLEIWYRF